MTFSACPVCEFGNLTEYTDEDGCLHSECNKCYTYMSSQTQIEHNIQVKRELKIYGEPLNWDLPHES